MKKHLIHSIMIATVLISQLYNSAVTALYQINYDYYSTVLCENQDKPELHCDGKCYFSKQLSLKENTPNSTEPPVLMPTLPLFAASHYPVAPLAIHIPTEIKPATYLDMELRAPHLSEIDHPPRV